MSGITLEFQIDWTHQPYDDPYTGWTTIPGTQSVTYSRGAPNEYGQFETGASEVIISDPDSNLDPGRTAATGYGIYGAYVRRTKPMRVRLSIDNGISTVVYPLFQHFIDRMPRLAKLGDQWSQRAIQGIDAFGLFAVAGLKGGTYSAESTGSRFGAVLDGIGWPAGRRSIDAGNSSLAAITFADTDDTKALAHLLDVITNESGYGYMDAEGTAVFIERHASIVNTTIRAVFADDRSIDTGSYPTAMRYVSLTNDSTDIVNDYTGTRTGGATMTSQDAQSIGEHGDRSQQLTFLLDSDTAVQDAIDWRLSRTKDPLERIDGITVMPGDDLDKWATLLGLEIGDRIQIVEYPPGYTAEVVSDYIIRHLSVSIPTAITGASFTFQLTPASIENWLILDDATFGMLDSNKLAY